MGAIRILWRHSFVGTISCIILYHVVFFETVTGVVHRFFHILGHSIVGQSRSMGMLGGFVSVFIRITIVSHMRRLYVCTVSVLPAVPCRQSPSPVSAGNPGSQLFFSCWEDSCSVAEGSIFFYHWAVVVLAF